MKILPNSLSSRLLVITAVWTVLALLVTGFTLSTLFRQNAERNFDNLLLAHVYNLMGAIDVNDKGYLEGTPNLGDPRFLTPLSGWYWMVSTAAEPGKPILNSLSISGDPLDVPSILTTPFSDFFRRSYQVSGPNNGNVQRLEAQLFVGEGETLFQVMVGASRAGLETAISDFNRSLLLFFGLFGAGTIIATYFVIRLGLRPLARAAHALGDVREGHAERIAGEYPKEIAPLVGEINGLIDANRSVVERARTQVGNLAHALKTPLAVISNETRGKGAPSSKVISGQANAMQGQIETYLNRARIAAQVGTVAARTDMIPVVNRLMRVMQKLSPNLKFSSTIEDNLVFAGEEQDLEEILGNLLENASNHAKSRVNLRISAPKSTSGGRNTFELKIEDDGPGVSTEKRGEILERGKRLDETTPGTGLGLSIVKDITEEYKGKLLLDDSELGWSMRRRNIAQNCFKEAGRLNVKTLQRRFAIPMIHSTVKLIAAVGLSVALTSCSIIKKPLVSSAATASPPPETALAFQADEKFGNDLTGADRVSLSSAERRALDYGKAGEQIGWKGQAAGVSGTIVASQPFRVGGSSCRRFEHKMNGAKGPAQTNGTACKREDGTWRLVR